MNEKAIFNEYSQKKQELATAQGVRKQIRLEGSSNKKDEQRALNQSSYEGSLNGDLHGVQSRQSKMTQDQ